jgi:hypothetical protein
MHKTHTFLLCSWPGIKGPFIRNCSEDDWSPAIVGNAKIETQREEEQEAKSERWVFFSMGLHVSRYEKGKTQIRDEFGFLFEQFLPSPHNRKSKQMSWVNGRYFIFFSTYSVFGFMLCFWCNCTSANSKKRIIDPMRGHVDNLWAYNSTQMHVWSLLQTFNAPLDCNTSLILLRVNSPDSHHFNSSLKTIERTWFGFRSFSRCPKDEKESFACRETFSITDNLWCEWTLLSFY